MNAVYQAFLENTFAEAMALAEKSDVIRLTPIPPLPPCGYLCEFAVPNLCKLSEGVVTINHKPVVAAVLFPPDYLHSTDPRLYLKVASVLEPSNLVHPNIRGGAVCLGSAFAPGTPITALLWELYDIVSGQNVTLDERNAMNPEACRLLRAHPELLAQLKPKPFLRRRHKLQIEVSTV